MNMTPFVVMRRQTQPSTRVDALTGERCCLNRAQCDAVCVQDYLTNNVTSGFTSRFTNTSQNKLADHA